MRPETYRAIKAIIETDSTIPEPERIAILKTCKSPIIKKPDKTTLLSSKQTAQALQVCPTTVRRMEKRGMLHGVRFSARTIRFRADEIEKIIETQTNKDLKN